MLASTQIMNENCPTNFRNKFRFVSGGRNSENCNLYVNRSASHKEFYYVGAKCWNNLPPDVRTSPDILSFSKSYKAQLLSSALADPNYIINNSLDYLYKPIENPSAQ